MTPTDPDGPSREPTATAPATDADTAATASPSPPPTPSTPSLASRELARLAGRDLHADRSLRYELGDLIGRGGMGEVYVARDLDIGRAVAVKRMRSQEPSGEAIARFLREARVQGRLEHPAIVPVHDLGVDSEGRPFFTMKRVTGTLLSELLARDLDRPRLLRAFVDVCLAVELAHQGGVVHRDLKPANIMLGELGEVYVLDWGVARVLGESDTLPAPRASPAPGDATSSGSDNMTADGAVLGTPGYMAPEQRRGAPDVGPPADVFALGCILFEILAGERLLPKDADRVVALPPIDPRPSARGADVAPELEAACIAACADEPAYRPSARELAARVQRYVDGDRDAVRRRALAEVAVAEAKAALARPDDPDRRAAAMRAAGRALALDPTCAPAAELVSRLVLEPPRAPPPEVARMLLERDRTTITQQGYLAAGSLAIAAVVFGVLMWLFVGSWPLAIVAWLVPTSSAAHAYAMSRRGQGLRKVDLAYVLVSNVAMIVLLSRLFGTYVMVPPVAAAAMSGLAVLPPFLGAYNRLWLVFSSAIVIPAVLEATGVWSRTTAFAGKGVVIGAGVHEGTELAVLGAILALLYAGGRYVHDLAVANRDAQAKLALQAWHLRQLIPGGD